MVMRIMVWTNGKLPKIQSKIRVKKTMSMLGDVSHSDKYLICWCQQFCPGQKKSAKNTSKPVKKAPPPPPPDISAYRPVISAAKEEELMSDILSSMDAAPLPIPKNRKRKSSPEYEASSSPLSSGSRFSTYRNSKLSNGFTSSDPPDEGTFPSSDDAPLSPTKKLKVGDSRGVAVTPAINQLTKMEFNTPGASNTSFDDMTFDTDDMCMDLDLNINSTTALKKEPDIQIGANVPAPRLKLMVKDEEKKEDALPSWLSVHAALNVTDDSVGTLDRHGPSNSSNVSALEEDGSLRFYWIDYLELDGKVYFVGKVLDKQTKLYASCCVTVEGLERNLYVLPRNSRVGTCFWIVVCACLINHR
jgi:DNA polymerase alpha subunit A